MQPAYSVTIHKESQAFLFRLDEGRLDRAMRFIRDHLQVNPTAPYPGLKKLKGEWSDTWQFDVSKDIKLLYTVDEALRLVTVDYIGHHPDWSKRRQWA